MTTRLPSIVCSGRGGVSSTHHHLLRNQQHARVLVAFPTIRHQSNEKKLSTPQTASSDLSRPEKAALVEIQGLCPIHPVNPPRSTRPPDLTLPSREKYGNVLEYWFRIGRAYGSFYWVGIKCVWFNWSASKLLRERVGKDEGAWEKLKRSEFQLLARNSHDIGKLPFFGVLVALFGEWLPLLVPFIPSAVPGTCRIPKQVEGMRGKVEERRREAFRRGIAEPEEGVEEGEMTKRETVKGMLTKLKDEQLFHLSCTLNVHNRLWDRVQLPPPAGLLRRGVERKLVYLARDDRLLARDGGVEGLCWEEVLIACEERGLDVLGLSEEKLRGELGGWLKRQEEDRGRGRALLVMLFRRPNAWATKVTPKK